MLKVRADSSPRELVAVRVYPPVEFPTRMFPYDGRVEIPVPPYTTESVLVAETTPLIAWRFPVREPMVRFGVVRVVPLKSERFPLASTEIAVEVANPDVEVESAKSALVPPEVPATESLAYGDVVPIPR